MLLNILTWRIYHEGQSHAVRPECLEIHESCDKIEERHDGHAQGQDEELLAVLVLFTDRARTTIHPDLLLIEHLAAVDRAVVESLIKWLSEMAASVGEDKRTAILRLMAQCECAIADGSSSHRSASCIVGIVFATVPQALFVPINALAIVLSVVGKP
jgi:hypothetical protein